MSQILLFRVEILPYMVPFCQVNRNSFWLHLTSFLSKPQGEFKVPDIPPEASCLCASGKGRGLTI